MNSTKPNDSTYKFFGLTLFLVVALVWALFSVSVGAQKRELLDLRQRMDRLERAHGRLFIEICNALQGRYSPREQVCRMPDGNEISFPPADFE